MSKNKNGGYLWDKIGNKIASGYKMVITRKELERTDMTTDELGEYFYMTPHEKMVVFTGFRPII
jgi:hypothetical protein